jgi:hypothetical protein
MKAFVRRTALLLASLFLAGAGLAWFDVLTHENVLANPELKTAGGWLLTGFMLLALGLRGRRPRKGQPAGTARESEPSPWSR